MVYFVQQAINALQAGSIYALVALGYSMVYGVLVMINFAHSALFMLGSYFCLLAVALLAKTAALPFIVTFLIVMLVVMLVSGALGATIELVAYRPLRNAPRVSAIITALGCGLMIENTTLSLSPQARRLDFPNDEVLNTVHNIGGVAISNLQILIIGISLILMLGLDFLIRKTRYGMAMRAISFDSRTVPLMGIPLNRIISMTFFIGAALGGAAGMLYGLAFPTLTATTGVILGWKAFVAAVIGGIGDIRGAVLGAFTLGVVEVISKITLPSAFSDLICYALLLVILIFKPYGLLGKAPNVKV